MIRTRSLVALMALGFFGIASFAAGCELAVDFDRNNIPDASDDVDIAEVGDLDAPVTADAGSDASPDAATDGEVDASPDGASEDGAIDGSSADGSTDAPEDAPADADDAG